MHAKSSAAIISGAAVILVASLATFTAGAQQTSHQPAAVKKGIARTPEGRPDLTGVWTNFDSTPLETPSADDTARLAPLEPWFPGISAPGERRVITGPNPSAEFSDINVKR